MNVLLRAQQGAVDTNDHRNVRCDTSGRLLTSVGASGVISQGNTIDTSAAAYSVGDIIGAGASLVTLISPDGAAGSNAVYEVATLAMVDVWNLKPDLEVLFFSGDPSAITAQVDNTAFSWGGGLPSVYCGKVSIVGADWSTVGTDAVMAVSNMGLLVKASLVGAFHAVVIAKSGAAYGVATAALYLNVGVKRL